MADWKFYGRKEQLADLERMLDRKRWFFAKVIGRRRIGKTTLIQQAIHELGSRQPVFYVQIPDSESAGVLSAMNDALEIFQVPTEQHPRPKDLLQLAKLLEAMAEDGYILILDEFQYFKMSFNTSIGRATRSSARIYRPVSTVWQQKQIEFEVG